MLSVFPFALFIKSISIAGKRPIDGFSIFRRGANVKATRKLLIVFFFAVKDDLRPTSNLQDYTRYFVPSHPNTSSKLRLTITDLLDLLYLLFLVKLEKTQTYYAMKKLFNPQKDL